MANGVIKRLVRDKGFGFVRDDAGTEHFFHRSGCAVAFDTLTEGQAVTFTEEPSSKGPRATAVQPRSLRS